MSYKSNITTESVIPTIREHLIGDGFEFVLDLEKSHGSFMHDALSGRDLLDFYTCFASNPVGFNHPKLKDRGTLDRLRIAAINNITSSDLFTDLKAEFVKTFFAKAAPSYMPHLFMIAGGALAVENALKASFDWKAKKNLMMGETRQLDLKVLHFKRAFHGRSGYTMSITNTERGKTELFPKFDWPRIENAMIKFPDEGKNHVEMLGREKLAIDQLNHAILTHGNSLAAFIIEPIQGEGGDNHFRTEFLTQIQTICNDNDIMFIIDEIQSGMGLTGKMWAFEHHGLKPDMICFGKKAQVCGFLASKRIDEVEDNVFKTSGRINSTWGGNLIDMVRCQRYLEIIEEDNLLANAAEMGKYMLNKLQQIQDKYEGIISNVRGRGLMCAFDVITPDKRDELRNKAFDESIFILPCGTNSIRFRPPLTINSQEIDQAAAVIDKVVATL
ncbi:MAG: L-lysine 6-transaminase [Calditrichaeota bacterium]|nr:L-lysine 6-transaminase [Calditrichota bacterium]